MVDGIRFDGNVKDELQFREMFRNIRAEVKRTDIPASLTDLYQFAAFLTALTDAPCWKMTFGGASSDYGALSREEFRNTAIEINVRAEQIGCELRFNEIWPQSVSRNHHELPRRRSLAR